MRHAVVNSSALMPATRAKVSRVSPPLLAARSMALSVWVMAVPPASASMPTELIAVASARICASLMPASLPAEASLVAISSISLSVVAKLLPSATSDEPRRDVASSPLPMILVSRAIATAASSAVRLVLSPRSSIVRVKLAIFSVATPSCPAFSATAAIVVVETPVSAAMRLISSDIAASCSGVPSTVFLTPVKALSNSMLLSAAAVMPSPIVCSTSSTLSAACSVAIVSA